MPVCGNTSHEREIVDYVDEAFLGRTEGDSVQYN